MRAEKIGLVALALLLAGVATADAGKIARKPANANPCQLWFEEWALAAKESMRKEQAMAKKLGIDERTPTQVNGGVESIVAAAKPFCERVLSTGGVVVSKHNTPAKNCIDTFSQWEDMMDQRFTQAIFDKDLLEEMNEYAPAQELARREARLAVRLCKALELKGD